jgi:hypothetical protein
MEVNEMVKFEESIREKIYSIRGFQVMLDRDLAELYGVKSRRLREQVKRNQKRFPADFTFQLNEKEISLMVSQNAIPSVKHLGGTNPYVFTEQGVAALSSILTSDIAIDISIKIMRAFVEMRKFLISNAQIFQRLDRVELNQIENDRKFDKIFSLMETGELKPKQGIFFENQAYDAYNFVSNIVKSAGKSVLVIDNYVDDSVLTILSKRKSGVKASIYTKNISAQLKLDVKKFNEQYGPVEVLEFDDSHDRFIVIDEKIIYHFGASLKNLGKKWFGFSKMDIEAVEMLSRLGK